MMVNVTDPVAVKMSQMITGYRVSQIVGRWPRSKSPIVSPAARFRSMNSPNRSDATLKPPIVFFAHPRASMLCRQ
jgi:hypothetical protein